MNSTAAPLVSLFAIALLAAGVAAAEPSSQVAWTVETLRMLERADPAAGKAVVERETCAECHGINGVADKITQPNIAGMSAAYLYKQLRDYKDGTREHRRMNRYVRKLSDQELAELAAWYASQPAPEARASQVTLAAAHELVRRGDGQRLIPACAACHGAAGQGEVERVVTLVCLVSVTSSHWAHRWGAKRRRGTSCAKFHTWPLSAINALSMS